MKKRTESASWKARQKKRHPVRATEQKKNKNNEDNLRELQDNIKCNNICIIWIPERDEKEQGIDKLFKKILTENFPNLVIEKVTQVQETRGPEQDESKPTTQHIIVKMVNFKDKERILNAARENS